MRTKPWLKLWKEARTDLKLRQLNDAEHRCWFNLLCYAGDQDTPGTVANISRQLLAIEVSGGDVEVLDSTLAKLETLQMIDATPCNTPSGVTSVSVVFRAWERRQRDKPSNTPERVNQRVAKHRDKKTSAKPDPCNAPVTPRNAREGEGEGEKKEESKQHAGEKSPQPEPDTIPIRAERFFKDRTAEDLGQFDEAIRILEHNPQTKHIVRDLKANLDTFEIGPLECWQILQAARVVQRPDKDKTWKFFKGCAKFATWKEFCDDTAKPRETDRDPTVMPSQTRKLDFHRKEPRPAKQAVAS